ncbi:vacuolar membrane protein [Apiospora sp. TS-2023a]
MSPVKPLSPDDDTLFAWDDPPSQRSSNSFELMEDTPPASNTPNPISAPAPTKRKSGIAKVARRTLGLACLTVTVFLWTASNFLASVPSAARRAPGKTQADEDEDVTAGERLLADEEEGSFETAYDAHKPEEKLSFRETARLSLEFCMIWFFSNYFASACLEYTSVGSVTILTSTSSVWTLILCALMKVESFTVRKLVGVLASLAGIVLISTVDLSGKDNDEDRGNFPHKSQRQIAIGDAMALFSALVYGLYVTVMKLRVGNEERVSMPLFFGMVGLFNIVFLWPLFIVLHVTGIETFELPPTSKVLIIIVLNSISSFLSDMSWAYAMLLTSPLLVTVGLSLTIPLSLIGEMIQYQQFSSFLYWVGAGIVLLSFLFINHESVDEDANDQPIALEDSVRVAEV